VICPSGYFVAPTASSSLLRANGSRECAPDDRLRDSIHCAKGFVGWVEPFETHHLTTRACPHDRLPSQLHCRMANGIEFVEREDGFREGLNPSYDLLRSTAVAAEIAPSGATKQSTFRSVARWIASRSLSSGAHSRDPLVRNDGKNRDLQSVTRMSNATSGSFLALIPHIAALMRATH